MLIGVRMGHVEGSPDGHLIYLCFHFHLRQIILLIGKSVYQLHNLKLQVAQSKK